MPEELIPANDQGFEYDARLLLNTMTANKARKIMSEIYSLLKKIAQVDAATNKSLVNLSFLCGEFKDFIIGLCKSDEFGNVLRGGIQL